MTRILAKPNIRIVTTGDLNTDKSIKIIIPENYMIKRCSLVFMIVLNLLLENPMEVNY